MVLPIQHEIKQEEYDWASSKAPDVEETPYQIFDQLNGTAYIMDEDGQRLTPDLWYDPGQTKFVAFDSDQNGADELYVKTLGPKSEWSGKIRPKYFAFDLSSVYGKSHDAWRSLEPLEIPFDFYDTDSEPTGDRCLGTDWFSANDTLLLEVWGGQLQGRALVGNAVIPALVMSARGYGIFSQKKLGQEVILDPEGKQYENYAEDVLFCALGTGEGPSPEVDAQLHSALWMLREGSRFNGETSYALPPLDFIFSYDGGKIAVDSKRDSSGQVTQITIFLEEIASLVGNKHTGPWAIVDEKGFVYLKKDYSAGSSSDYSTAQRLPEDVKDVLITALRDYQGGGSCSAGDRDSISRLIDLIENPPREPVVFK